jgi:hypothetical protein
MSRGFGHVQRFVLCELDEQCVSDGRWLAARTLAARFEGGDPSESGLASVRRALRLLAASGLVELAHADPTSLDRADRAKDRSHRRQLLARVSPAMRGDAVMRRASRRRTAELLALLGQRATPTGARVHPSSRNGTDVAREAPDPVRDALREGPNTTR